jgi:flagellum-specific peptidoglycan hydrolase FlgJ
LLHKKITAEEYIAQYKDLAIREMKRMGVPAAITLAQGILETESGNSVLVKKSNNHFGIKCKSTWTANGVSHDDDAVGECFRQYKTAEDSYRDHSNFLRGGDRYAFLFKLKVDDYRGWAYGLKKAGYATNPKYPEILIKNIEQYNLNQYTLMAIDEVPKFDASKYEDDKEEPVVVPKEEPVNNEISPVVTNTATVYNGTKAVFAAKGTSVLAVAEKNNIRLVKLLEYNTDVKDGLLEKDQWLYLEKPKALTTATTTTVQYHIVQQKEGLYAIAKKYNVTVTQIKEWNNLATDNLSIGQKLIVNK